MVRPMNLLAQHAAMELGEKMFNFFTCILPCIVAAKLYTMHSCFPPHSRTFYFSIECSSRKYDLFTSQHNIGLYGFLAWKCLVYPMVFDSSNVCFWRRNDSFLVFAGQVEYHYMVYAVPLCSVYTDGNVFRASVYESNHFNLCLQVLWLLGLLLLERFVWYRAQKKIVVQGG